MLRTVRWIAFHLSLYVSWQDGTPLGPRETQTDVYTIVGDVERTKAGDAAASMDSRVGLWNACDQTDSSGREEEERDRCSQRSTLKRSLVPFIPKTIIYTPEGRLLTDHH
jgi:hypothetical protein